MLNGDLLESLKDKLGIIREEIAKYAGPALNGRSYLTQSSDGCMFVVVDISTQAGKHFADAGLIIRIEGDQIIIEHDMNNKPLVDALVQAGIPREQIILAYAGESVPTTPMQTSML